MNAFTRHACLIVATVPTLAMAQWQQPANVPLSGDGVTLKGEQPPHILDRDPDCNLAIPYPPQAMRAHVVGTTTVRLAVDSNGRIVHSEIVLPSGPTREHAILDRTARMAFESCPFAPGMDLAGHRVGGNVELSYVWRLAP